MERFNILNNFFNIIAGNESAYMRYMFSQYDHLDMFCQWLKEKQIKSYTLDSIDQDIFKMLSPKMKANDVNAFLHQDFMLDMNQIAQTYKDRLHVVMLPPIDKTIEYHLHIKNEAIDYYEVDEVFNQNDLSFFDPFPAFLIAMTHCDMWGGVLIFNQSDEVFYPIHSEDDVKYVTMLLEENQDVSSILKNDTDDSYFLHLSDLHLGKDKNIKGLNQLDISLENLIPKLHTSYLPKVLITGDLMDTPNRKNMYLANDFMNDLKKKYKANVTFILGNHDVIVHGFNMARNQKSKVVAYLLGENIKVIEDEKIIIIKIDTTSEGNLARGKVGLRQLQEIDDELEAIDHKEDYTFIVMLHHHVYPITKAQFLKTKWHEKTFINRIIETSKVLIDAKVLIDWLEKNHIQYVLHGHKHLPFFRRVDGKYIISGGSSTGGLKESKSKYISYNLLKYNVHEKKMKLCIIFYDDKTKSECQRAEVYLFEEE